MRLTKQESDVLAGKEGEAQRIAMSVLVDIGNLYGADEMIGISQAHCDTSFYVSEAGLEFVEHLANIGAKAIVPASTNASLIDMERWREYRVSTELREIHERIEKVHRQLGIAPTYTCAPYQAGLVPRFGEQIAWTESNAIAFANSVIGARTNRYGDLMDICAAIIGKVPGFDLHLAENRKAEILIRLKDFSDEMIMDPSIYPLLGYVTGEIAGDRVAAIEGIPPTVKIDCLKGFSAAAASSGGVGLFHVIGVTPEAQTREMCLRSNEEFETVDITPPQIQATKKKLWTATSERIDLVALGCPHFSYMEFMEFSRHLGQKKVHENVAAWIFTSRAVYGWVENSGLLKSLQNAGVMVFTDGCPLMYPREAWGFHVVMTNSAKMANYCHSQTGLELAYGSLEQCVSASVTGKIIV